LRVVKKETNLHWLASFFLMTMLITKWQNKKSHSTTKTLILLMAF